MTTPPVPEQTTTTAMPAARLPLVQALLNPAACAHWSLAEWDVLIRQARRARLLPSLALRLASTAVPEHPSIARALTTARVAADATAVRMRWELTQLLAPLARAGVRPLLLKGAAYLIQDLPASHGRLFADIDLLVPREKLAITEDSLRFAGYVSNQLDAYDQRYYRQWTHELPPLQHRQRLITLDVHHNILPLTARAKPDATLLLAQARPAADARFSVLQPCDQVLHSMCHLFYDGEWDHALRDLWDMHQLLDHYSAEPGFWQALPARADALDLARPFAYAITVLQEVFASAIPVEVLAAAQQRLPRIGRRAMHALFLAALRPDHPSCRRPVDTLARFALYLRGHYLRMPPHLLLPHLIRKAIRREPERPESPLAERDTP